MNILIIGGLMGLAVVAILGAVLLGIREDHAEKAQAANVVAATTTLPSTPAISRATGQLSPPGEDERLALRRTGQLSAPNEEERFTILNGQVHEITNELRALALKAGELEQRLSDLSEVLERQPYRQAGATGQLYASRADTSSL